LRALSDISVQTTTGNYSLNVDAGTSTTNIHGETKTQVAAGRYEVKVTGGETKLWNTDSPTNVLSHGKVTVHSQNDAMDLLAKNAAKMKSDTSTITLEAPNGDITATTSKKIKLDCTEYEETSSDRKSFWGKAADIIRGKRMIINGADFFTVGVSTKIEVAASLKFAVSLAFGMEYSTGLVIKNAAGPAEIKIKNIDLKTKQITIAKDTAQLGSTATALLKRASITVISA
jgi:hypothetical protein